MSIYVSLCLSIRLYILSLSLYLFLYVSYVYLMFMCLSMYLSLYLCLAMSIYVSLCVCNQKNFSMVHESSIRCSPAPSVPAIEAVLLLSKYFCLGKLVHPLLWKSYLLFFSLILCLLICHFGSFTLIQ